MFFRFGDFARSGLKAATCYEAVLDGSRTSTTRFETDSPQQFERWRALRTGDVVRIWSGPFRSGWTGRWALIEITAAAKEIDVASFNEGEARAWSEAEGWSPSKIAEWILTGHQTKGIQIRYRLLHAQPAAQAAFSVS